MTSGLVEGEALMPRPISLNPVLPQAIPPAPAEEGSPADKVEVPCYALTLPEVGLIGHVARLRPAYQRVVGDDQFRWRAWYTKPDGRYGWLDFPSLEAAQERLVAEWRAH
jgi:hypothetical protein